MLTFKNYTVYLFGIRIHFLKKHRKLRLTQEQPSGIVLDPILSN